MIKKVKNSTKEVFNSGPLYNEKYLKAKIKSYDRKIKTIPKEGSQFLLSVILMEQVIIIILKCL